MNKYFQQALKLARRTGDRLIVFDSAKNQKPVVVMDIDAYEDLVDESEWLGPDMWEYDDSDDLTDMDNLDRINSDAAPWERVRSEPDPGIYTPADDLDDYETKAAKMPDFGPSLADLDEMEDDEDEGFDPGFDPDAPSSRRKGPNWAIPTDRKAAAEEVIDDEDPQYLEEIRY
jgi:hypothetical protein